MSKCDSRRVNIQWEHYVCTVMYNNNASETCACSTKYIYSCKNGKLLFVFTPALNCSDFPSLIQMGNSYSIMKASFYSASESRLYANK